MRKDNAGQRLSAITVEQRIMLHLLPFSEDKIGDSAPPDVTQEGLERALMVKRGQISRSAFKLKEKGLIEERQMRVTGGGRRRKVYLLTSEGRRQARELLDYIGQSIIFVRDLMGNRKVMQLRDAAMGLPGGILPNEIINEVNEGNELDYSHVIRKREATDPTHGKGLAFGSDAMIGRVKESEMLSRALSDARKGAGGNYFLVGEAGIGKSRLLKEVEGKASRMGFVVLKGYCLYRRETDPYHPLIEAFDINKAKQDVESVSGLGILPLFQSEDRPQDDLPLGLIHLSDADKVSSQGNDPDRFMSRMLYYYSALIEKLSSNRPVLLIFEDIHWSDRASLQVVHFLSRMTRDIPVLMVATFRPEELVEEGWETHPLKALLQRVSRESLFEIINLERLTRPETEQMLAQILQNRGLPESFVDMVFRESEGNPLFVEEILKSMMDSQNIVKVGNEWQLERAGIQKVPKNISDLINLRISGLGKEARRVLEFGSVAGYDFDFDILRSCVGMDEAQLMDLLDKMLDALILTEAGAGDDILFRFTHKKIREVLYTNLSSVRARAIHLKIGMSLEEKYKSDRHRIVYDLAHHFTHGRDYPRAIKYNTLAGDKANQSYAIGEAISYYESALSMCDKARSGDPMEKMRLLGTLAYAYVSTLNFDRALECANEALSLNKAIGDDIMKAQALIVKGVVSLKNEGIDEAIATFRAVLGLGLKNDLPWLQSAAYVRLSLAYRRKGEYDKAREWVEKAVESGMTDKASLDNAYCEYGILEKERGNLDRAIEYYHRSLAIGEETSNAHTIACITNNLGSAYFAEGEGTKAIRYIERCIQISREIGYVKFLMYGLNNAAHYYNQVGKGKKALEFCNEAFKLARRYDDPFMIGAIQSTYGNIYHKMNDWKRATEYYNRGLQIFKELDIPYYTASVHFEMGQMYKEKGDRSAMMASLKKALGMFRELGVKHYIEQIEGLMAE